jgi:hypothetical protein
VEGVVPFNERRNGSERERARTAEGPSEIRLGLGARFRGGRWKLKRV